MKLPIFMLSVIFIGINTREVSSSRILGVFPHIGKSHFFVFEPLLKALALRGHDVYVISHFPQKSPLTHYHDISVEGAVTSFAPTGGIAFQHIYGKTRTGFQETLMLGALGTETCEVVLSYPSVQKLLHSDEKFDIVLSELFNTECFLGFAYKFQAPHITMSSCNTMPWANERFGNPDNPSYIPTIMGSFSDRLSFIERLENTIMNIVLKTIYRFVYMRQSQKVMTKYFGEDVPSIDELAKNTSLIFVNIHSSLNRPRPLVPAVIEIGGIHVQPVKKLPEELETWISDAKDGVIFFSMGSMLRAETLPDAKLDALLAAFRELPQRILWKWEGDSLPGQPDNVKIAKWLPQRDILAHPNVRLFMTHCGLLGVIEAVDVGIPMIGTPMYGDQVINLRALQVAGVAVELDYSQLSKESVLLAIRTVLNNASYTDNAKRLSSQYLDRPSSPMDTAIFWTEYVIRHKGAQHLRSAAVHLPWYQYLLLDVILAILAVIIGIGMLVRITIKKIRALCLANADKRKSQ